MKFFILVMFALGVATVSAEEFKHVISGASDSGIDIDRGESDTSTLFSFTGSYAYHFGAGIQLESALGGAFYFGGEDNESNLFAASIGPVFNVFCTDKNKLQNAFFFTPKFGIARIEFDYGIYEEEDTVKFITIEFGKRFALSDQVSWNLSLAGSQVMDEDAYGETPKMDFRINLISFSFYL